MRYIKLRFTYLLTLWVSLQRCPRLPSCFRKGEWGAKDGKESGVEEEEMDRMRKAEEEELVKGEGERERSK